MVAQEDPLGLLERRDTSDVSLVESVQGGGVGGGGVKGQALIQGAGWKSFRCEEDVSV